MNYPNSVGVVTGGASGLGLGLASVIRDNLIGTFNTQRGIRVCTIAPGIFETPLLARLPDSVRASLDQADALAALAPHILDNTLLNGETLRLDGALRMPPR